MAIPKDIEWEIELRSSIARPVARFVAYKQGLG